MPRPADHAALLDEILGILRSGPAAASAIYRQLGISQPLFSRVVRQAGPRLLVVGRARATRYAAPRTLDGVTLPIPIYSVRPAGERPRHLADLHPIHPGGFYLAPVSDRAGPGVFFDDLPWFLSNCRPEGFLGRLLPRRYPTPGAPGDIRLWSADHVLRFATHHGWNLPGALVAGREAFADFVALAATPPDRVAREARARTYPQLAEGILAFGSAGSSAAGEQPKFLATRDDDGRLVPVLVKFSPPLRDDKAVRAADLLIAEHIVHEILQAAGHPTARSQLLCAGDRVFLEVERFDRQGSEHRRGLVALAVVDAELVGSRLDRWSTTTAALVQRGLLGEADHREVRWLEVFGGLIANSDMHHGNLSLWLDDLAIAGLAPCYDMLPMRYAVRDNEIVPTDFIPPLPSPADADVARTAHAAALAFWRAVASRDEVSTSFRSIARDNAHAVEALGPALDRLP